MMTSDDGGGMIPDVSAEKCCTCHVRGCPALETLRELAEAVHAGSITLEGFRELLAKYRIAPEVKE